MTTVFGVENISQFINFEDQVHLDHTSFIDGYIEKTHVMIEQKSIIKRLTTAIRKSDGSMLIPFEQAKRYSSELPYSKRPRWIVTSNFKAAIELFQVLDTKQEDRDPYLEESLAAFPYVNGGLFADENIEIPQFIGEISQLLLEKASADFN